MLGMNPVKPIVLFLSLVFSGVLFAGTGLAKPETGTSQKWAVVSGFRSAQFGMNERDILKAIKSDFGLGKKQVSRQVHPNEKTITLGIKVSKLLPESGPAKIFYILGYKTRRLIHINVIWGRPVMKDPNAEAIRPQCSTGCRGHPGLSGKRSKRKGRKIIIEQPEIGR